MCYRCGWAENNELEKTYHDTEWGNIKHDDQQLFECLSLESMQSGLSWLTILKKRDTIREAFDEFDIDKISQYSMDKVEELLTNEGIIRHRQKILAIINNAKIVKLIQAEYGSFDEYIWSFVQYKPIMNTWSHLEEVPSQTEISNQLSKDMKKRGFKFVGSTTVYSFMQSVGMVNDHINNCFRKHS